VRSRCSRSRRSLTRACHWQSAGEGVKHSKRGVRLVVEAVLEDAGEEAILVGLDDVGVVGERVEHVVDAALEVLGLLADEGVVAVVLDLHLVGFVLVAGVLEVLDRNVEAVVVADLGDGFGDLDDADGARGLVVDDVVVGAVVRVGERELGEALHGVLEADERLALFALPVHRHGVAGDGLGGEAVGDRPEVVVEVEARAQAVVRARLLGLGAVDDGGADVTNRNVELLVGQPHVRGVVALGEVVPGAGHRGERHLVAVALVFHGGAALGNGELGRAVDARRGRLDEVCVREVVCFESPEEVARGLEVVVLGVVRALAVNLGVRRRRLCSRVDDGVGFVDGEQLVDEVFVREVALDEGEVREAVDVLGGVEAGFDGVDGRRGDGADFVDPFAAREVVHEQYAVVSVGGDA